MTEAPIITTLSLPVMEHFYTLQGEGVHQGKAAYFIRLGGCDVGCVWCDVKESWDASRHPHYTIDQLVAQVKSTPSPIAVITGGEPLIHDLTLITKALHAAGVRTHMETSGSSPLTGEWDWITLSPKKFKAPLPEVVPHASELKVVVFNKSDFAWAEQYASQVGPDCKLFLQPEWTKADAITPLIIDYIKDHPQWQLSLQIHKYINVP
ncbi:MAG TPA: 7-carboxy-7-deazaguanine synthase QueE [Flavisolibacter sp.]|jgi:organic radical activating enzyme|nr:7-carboxy-7-deazaguanine synthase QueE [Flavisolibacter sp.]